ncbi:class I SAM-dependent methyltransferase [Chitinispirillales bacterium ANBcel5]|uniref:class I SAM-dependent methyltransferase n=1 Tax=Cellulosispirillum alkaliphilum TaxID=3039283 RepID=UPI002A592CBE|nr:class I SAM-dependent methyltransferase [Chitinispirillales bacterium ANBcel5]
MLQFRIGSILTTLVVVCMIGCYEEEGERSIPRTPDVHFVPTPHKVVDVMLNLADVQRDDIVYDLGCGDGRIVIAAAKKSGCRAWGFDIDPEMVAISRENVRKERVHRLVTIEEKDIFELDLTEATVITLYLLPHLNVQLLPQLDELKPGTRIVSHAFNIAGIKPDVVARVYREDGGVSFVFMYTTPLERVSDEEFEDIFDEDELETTPG